MTPQCFRSDRPITRTSPASEFFGIDRTITYGTAKTPILPSTAGLVDTGTTLIGGPTSGVQNLYAAIPGSQALGGEMEGFFAYRASRSISS